MIEGTVFPQSLVQQQLQALDDLYFKLGFPDFAQGITQNPAPLELGRVLVSLVRVGLFCFVLTSCLIIMHICYTGFFAHLFHELLPQLFVPKPKLCRPSGPARSHKMTSS